MESSPQTSKWPEFAYAALPSSVFKIPFKNGGINTDDGL
jgi:hypothetical protein